MWLLTHTQAFLFSQQRFYLIEKVYLLYSLMLQIAPYSFLTYSMCDVFLHSLSLLWQDFSQLSLFVALPFVQTAWVLCVWYLAHVWQKKEVQNDSHRQALCTQFIDMLRFKTNQIKFGNPASAVMYYKAQMGGRERGRERNRDMEGEESSLAGRQRHSAGVPVFASEGTWYSSKTIWNCGV